MIRTKDSSVNVTDLHPKMKAMLEDLSNRFDGIVVTSGKDAKHSVFNSRHYCLPLDTKILTQDGFKYYSELKIGDYTVGFNDKTKTNEWTKINDVFKFENVDLYQYYNKENKIVCTENHKWLTQQKNYLYQYDYKNIDGKVKRDKIIGKKERTDVRNKLIEIDKMYTSDRIMFSSKINGCFYKDIDLTIDEVKLIAWFITDGTISTGYRIKSKEVVYDAAIYQKKKEFFPHIEKTLDSAGAKYSRRDNHNKQNVTRWLLKREFTDRIIKKSKIKENDGIFRFVLSLDVDKLKAFIDVCQMAEGGNKENYKYIYQYKKDVKLGIGLASYLLGNFAVYTKCGVYQRRPCIQKGKLKKIFKSKEDVFCISTNLKSFTILQNNRIMLTGNSGKAIDIGAGSSNKKAYQDFKDYVLEGRTKWHLPNKFAEYEVEDILDEKTHIHIELVQTPSEVVKAIVADTKAIVTDNKKTFAFIGLLVVTIGAFIYYKKNKIV